MRLFRGRPCAVCAALFVCAAAAAKYLRTAAFYAVCAFLSAAAAALSGGTLVHGVLTWFTA